KLPTSAPIPFVRHFVNSRSLRCTDEPSDSKHAQWSRDTHPPLEVAGKSGRVVTRCTAFVYGLQGRFARFCRTGGNDRVKPPSNSGTPFAEFACALEDAFRPLVHQLVGHIGGEVRHQCPIPYRVRRSATDFKIPDSFAFFDMRAAAIFV